MTPEDEAFNDIERQAKQRKEAVLQALHDENERLGLYKDAYGTTKEQLMAEVAILTELVRVLSGRVTELEKGKEPVAWNLKDVTDAYKLGAKSQQGTWVGLTDEDKRKLATGHPYASWEELCSTVEAKLKERNT
jgi:hypothetical protein